MSGDPTPNATHETHTDPALSVVILGGQALWHITRDSVSGAQQRPPRPVTVPYEVVVDDSAPGTASAAEQIRRGVAAAQARTILLVTGGAPVLTPRVVDYTLRAFRVSEHAVVRIPDYLLTDPNSGPAQASAALDHIDWPHDGYRLFHVAVPHAAAPQESMLRPGQQTRCLAFSRQDYEQVDNQWGGTTGQWDAAHELGRALDALPHTRPFVLPGEGAFHQIPPPAPQSPAPYPDTATYQASTLLGAVTGWAIPSLRTDIAANLPDPVVS